MRQSGTEGCNCTALHPNQKNVRSMFVCEACSACQTMSAGFNCVIFSILKRIHVLVQMFVFCSEAIPPPDVYFLPPLLCSRHSSWRSTICTHEKLGPTKCASVPHHSNAERNTSWHWFDFLPSVICEHQSFVYGMCSFGDDGREPSSAYLYVHERGFWRRSDSNPLGKREVCNLDGREVGHLPKHLWRPKMFVIGCDCWSLPIWDCTRWDNKSTIRVTGLLV